MKPLHALALPLILAAGFAVADEAPYLEKTDIFHAGQDGYAIYRIPGIVVTSQGTLLAVGPDRSIYCFYERGGVDGNHTRPKSLCVAKFNLAWVARGGRE
jgi:hypothetical protein